MKKGRRKTPLFYFRFLDRFFTTRIGLSTSMVDVTPEKRALTYIEERTRTEFEPEAATAFVT
ncbi:MAG: hypothetical protein JWL97_178 [Gemmatimonadales bacterium]|nr:hypothetical protein [Gemmatimonadales bacterium]